jgi:hypothetical protein
LWVYRIIFFLKVVLGFRGYSSVQGSKKKKNLRF